MLQYIWRTAFFLSLLEFALLLACQQYWADVSLKVSPKTRVDLGISIEGWSVLIDRAGIADWRQERPVIDVTSGSDLDLDPDTRALLPAIRERVRSSLPMPWRFFAEIGITVWFNGDGSLLRIALSHELLLVGLVSLMTAVYWIRRRCSPRPASDRSSDHTEIARVNAGMPSLPDGPPH